jgi:hypothetical protein
VFFGDAIRRRFDWPIRAPRDKSSRSRCR